MFFACVVQDSVGADTQSGLVCAEGIEVGDCAPDFTFPDQTGNSVSLGEQAGLITIVASSASW